MVKLPFFSKKTKQILKDDEERIFLLSEEEQEKLLARTQLEPTEEEYIEPKTLLDLLVKENVELKVLHDSLQEELAKKMKQGKDSVIEIGNGYWIYHNNIKVKQDNKIDINKKWKDVDIRAPSFIGKLPGYFVARQFRTWFIESEGEYTIDPRDKTPIEIKKANEMQLELGHKAAKKNLGAALIEDLGSKIQKWWEKLGVPIIITVIIFLFLLFMGLFFGQYNFQKA